MNNEDIIDKILYEIMRIRTLPEQFQEWKGYRNLPKFLEELKLSLNKSI